MNPPTAENLFLNVWSASLHGESLPAPGDPDWDRKKMAAYWGRVWLDCLELAQHLQRCGEGAEAVTGFVRDPTPTPPSPTPQLFIQED